MRNLIALIVILLYSCSTNIEPSYADSYLKACVNYVKTYSENFNPTREPNKGIAILPTLPDSILTSFKVIRTNRTKDYEKYLSLIFIKIYSAHMECCQQGYNLQKQKESFSKTNQKEEPLLFAFNNLTGFFSNNKPVEFINSAYGFNYVKDNPHLLQNQEIKKHFDIILKVQENIEKGVYWK